MTKEQPAIRGSATPMGVAPVKLPRTLASALDVLVRSSRVEGANLDDIANRVVAIWNREPGMALVLTPVAVVIAGEVALGVGGQEGSWLLPAHMAGLRTVRANPDFNALDAIQLAEQLSRLEPTPVSVRRFRDWLWCGGATGFEIGMDVSTLDIFEALDLDTGQEVVALARGQGPGSRALEPGACRGGFQGLPPEEVEQLFHAPVLAYDDGMRHGRYQLTQGQRDALLAGCDNPELWVLAEASTALVDPRIAAGIAPARIALGIQARLDYSADLELLALLTSLSCANDDHSRAVLAELSHVPVGSAIARELELSHPEVGQRLGAFVRRASRKDATDLINGLLERADSEVEAFDAMTELIGTIRMGSFVETLDPSHLSETAAVNLVYVCLECVGEEMNFSSLVAKAPPPIAVAMVATLPQSLRTEMPTQLRQLLASVEGTVASRLVRLLLGSGSADDMRMLGEELGLSHGHRWTTNLTRAVCHGLVDRELAAEYLIPVARSRKAPAELRLIALNAMEANPELIAEAAKRRAGEVLDPPEVRQKLKALRRSAEEEAP